jgi:opacity protein-like surface antigen
MHTMKMNAVQKTLAGMVLGGLLIAGAGLPALAQNTLTPPTTLLPTTNTREINLAASIFLDGAKPYALSGAYGLFISPNIEVGATGSVAGANNTKTLTTLGGFADYYFRGSESAENVQPLVPYVGVFAGYSHKEESDASLGAQAGVKYFFNPNVAVTGEYQYRSTRHGNGSNQIVLGLSTFFH